MKKITVLFLTIICFMISGCSSSEIGSIITASTPLHDPVVTYGEFPFELTYMLDEERITIKDVYICEYVGAYWDYNQGHYRKWHGYLKSTNEIAVFITEDADRKIYCFVGDAEFYMNDEKYPEKRPLTPRLYNITANYNVDSLSPDEIMEYYKIEIISWNFSEPINNSFD